MSTGTAALKEVTAGAPATQKPKDFPAMLQVWLPEIKRARPKHLNAERMSRIALTAFRRTPKLAECDPRSVFAAVIQASQLGLEPDTLGRSYLIPYKVNKKVGNQWESHHECQFVPGWKGLMDLMNRSGQGSAWTGAVFEGDYFEYMLGDSPFVKHEPRGEDSVDKLTHVYAVGRAKGTEWPVIEVWPIAKVRKHRDRYNKVGDKHYSHGNWEMYARKVVLLQVLKYLPCSAELTAAMALNDAAEIGAQKIDLKDAIEGTWETAIDETGGAGGEGAVTRATIAAQIAAATSVEAVDLALDSAVDLPPDDIAALSEEAKKARERLSKGKK
jgi:recombination protein RecT